jgi:hypothetical protein
VRKIVYVIQPLDQYRKHTKILKENRYCFPSEIFSIYGIKRLVNDIDEIRAKDIPEVLKSAFLFEFSEDELLKYMGYKDKRNNIAHGEIVKYSMSETIEMFDFFNNLAWKIDQYLVDHFYINERYY